MKKQTGFTLIELMIVVLIVGILAAVAIPSYTAHIQKTQRVDGKQALAAMAAAQERFMIQNLRYAIPGEINELGGNSSPDGDYLIAIINAGCAAQNDTTCPSRCNSPDLANPTCFILQATARARQATDDQCAVFYMGHTGRTTSVDADGNASTDVCWN